MEKRFQVLLRFLCSSKLNFIVNQSVKAGLIFEKEATFVDDVTTGSTDDIALGVNFEVDTKDNDLFPTDGFDIVSTYKYVLERNNIAKQFLQKIEFTTNFYYELYSYGVATASLNVREIIGSVITESGYYFLGGMFSLRGYSERQFAGNRLVWSNIELRNFLSETSYAFVFLDLGSLSFKR